MEPENLVNLYIILDAHGTGAPRLATTKARECAKTYRFVGGHRAYGFHSFLSKTHRDIHLTPREAMETYIETQDKRAAYGRAAAVRAAQVRAMLQEINRN